MVAEGCDTETAAHRIASVGFVPDAPLSPIQRRNLELLRRPTEPLVFDPAFVAALTDEAKAAMQHLSGRLKGERMWVSKGRLANVHGCEVKYLLPDEFEWKPSTAAGFISHKAIELAVNWQGEPDPGTVVDEALAIIAEQADNKGDYVARLGAGERAELRSRVVDRVTKFLHDFPPLRASFHPVLEAASKWQPPGTIELSGKVDLAIGKPEGDESRILIVDFKSGNRSPQHRDDLRFYALLHTLRQQVPPRKVATYYLDYSEGDAEDVTEGMLTSALARTVDGIERHIELVAEDRAPVKRVGVPCRWCPLRTECPEGRVYLNTDDTDVGEVEV